MNQNVAGRMVVGLDIGTSKIVAIVGELSPEGQLEIIGIGSHASRGLKKVWWSILTQPCNPYSGG